MTLHRSPQHAAQSRWQARWTAILEAQRVVFLALLILCVFVVFSLRLWHVQFVQGKDYRTWAERQRLKPVVIPAERGIIYDRTGVPLVRNVSSFNVGVVTAYLPDDEDEAESVLIRLAVLLDMPYSAASVRGSEDKGLREIVPYTYTLSYDPLVVKPGVDRDMALLLKQEAMTLPGVSVDVASVRDYPYGPLVSQVLGYLLPIPEESEEKYVVLGYDAATDRVGNAGVEATYEDTLRGEKGVQIVEEDVMGRVIRVIEEQAVPVPGDSVHLTIDLDLQRFVEEALRRGMAQPGVDAPRGVAIAMNPQTGEILALVSLPTYDNNVFTHGISARELQRLNDPHRPLFNHAISDYLQPGSTFKIVMAAVALQEGVLTPRTRLSCPGTIVVPNKYYPNDPGQAQSFYCWNRHGHGSLDVVGGIAHSCNIFFYKVGGGFEETDFEGLGVERIAQYAQLFGFGEPTGVELLGEIGGLVPTRTWKRLTYGESWSTGDTYNLSIGEGYLSVTPLQMLNAANVVANGGTLYRPHIVHHLTDSQGVVTQPFEPEIIRTLPISPENWSLVQQGMEGAVVYGTAPRAQIEGLRVAGKTGTAQYCDDIAAAAGLCAGTWPEHAWFVAFAPVEKPEISVIAFLYNGGEGSVVAVPVVHDILEYYFSRDETAP
ncbi:MAG: penicillin-binding protein 2 [Chloroflexota bacterium]|nr:penicillin-binding protein 2 [Chloroflexota bacterium]